MLQSSGAILDRDILPVITCSGFGTSEPLTLWSFEGTGFLLEKNIFVTCWHFVRTPLREGREYAVVVETDEGNTAWMLSDISKDANGTDLATVRVPLEPNLGLVLAHEPVLMGADVWTFGYPLTRGPYPLSEEDPARGKRIELEGRYLRGYVTRTVKYEDPHFGETPCYELDMPAPAGLSGAPIVERGSKRVIGVVFKEHYRGDSEEYSRTTFALAHYTETLLNLRGSATLGLTLPEYLDG